MSNYQKLYYSNQEDFLSFKQYKAKKPKKYGVIFLGGFKSDMEGTKATALQSWSEEKDLDFVRFDYFGHGSSSRKFVDCSIGIWLENAVKIIDEIANDKKQILVGSSMGGWLMLLLALKRPERVAGLVGIAAAPDFTEELIWEKFSDLEKDELLRGNEVKIDLGDFVTKKLILEARDHLLLNGPIEINCPTILIHGMVDEDVPYQTSLRIADKIISKDVLVSLIKEGDHRLSNPQDLKIIFESIEKLFLQ